jgi:UDP-N-acetylglucosamine 2-epimerase
MILFRKESFPEEPGDREWNENRKKDFNFNDDTVFIKRGNYLLLSVHLSSKAVNVKQAKEMFDALDQVLKENPHLELILGADSNHFMNPK